MNSSSGSGLSQRLHESPAGGFGTIACKKHSSHAFLPDKASRYSTIQGIRERIVWIETTAQESSRFGFCQSVRRSWPHFFFGLGSLRSNKITRRHGDDQKGYGALN